MNIFHKAYEKNKMHFADCTIKRKLFEAKFFFVVRKNFLMRFDSFLICFASIFDTHRNVWKPRNKVVKSESDFDLRKKNEEIRKNLQKKVQRLKNSQRESE